MKPIAAKATRGRTGGPRTNGDRTTPPCSSGQREGPRERMKTFTIKLGEIHDGIDRPGTETGPKAKRSAHHRRQSNGNLHRGAGSRRSAGFAGYFFLSLPLLFLEQTDRVLLTHINEHNVYSPSPLWAGLEGGNHERVEQAFGGGIVVDPPTPPVSNIGEILTRARISVQEGSDA